MRAGKLDRRVQFLRKVIIPGALDDREKFEAHGSPVFASKKDVSDGEKWGGGDIAATISCRFVVRYSSFTADISPKDRLRSDDATYGIVGIKEVGSRRTYLEISAIRRLDK